MPRYLFHIASLLILPLAPYSKRLEVTDLRGEYKANPLGVSAPHPYLHWEQVSDGRDVVLSTYHVLIACSAGVLRDDNGNVWDTHKKLPAASIQIPYLGHCWYRGGLLLEGDGME